jgi:protein subunit release factor B
VLALVVAADLEAMQADVERLEFERMFSARWTAHSCYLDIQSGSGGTEAQDWAEMLLRMYLRWAERHGWQAELVEVSAGEVAGIKSATVHIQGEYAYGWCRTETGVHRLVRIVVQCQNDRSQHRAKDHAMEATAGQLYELELQKRLEAGKLEETKSDLAGVTNSVLRARPVADQGPAHPDRSG